MWFQWCFVSLLNSCIPHVNGSVYRQTSWLLTEKGSSASLIQKFYLYFIGPSSCPAAGCDDEDPQHSVPLLPESSNGSQSSVSTVEANSLLASPFTSRNRRILRWRNQCLYCKWCHSVFLQGAKLLYNDYIEEYLRQRGWSNAREMKTESRSWHFILHYSPWDRRHKYSKLPVKSLFFLEWMTSKAQQHNEMNERFSLSVFRGLSNNLHASLYSSVLVNIYITML